MRNRTLALIIILAALASGLAACETRAPTEPEQVPHCSTLDIDFVGYESLWGTTFNDTLTVGDSVPVLAYSTSVVGGVFPFDDGWGCLANEAPLTVGLSWSSFDDRVATVAGGVLHARKPGTTLIHAAWNDGKSAETATFPLTVLSPSLQLRTSRDTMSLNVVGRAPQ